MNCIIARVANLDNNIFSPSFDTSDQIAPILKTLFYGFVKNPRSFKNKFVFFKKTNNCFLHFSRDDFARLFCKMQQTYRAFSTIAYLFKYKKAIIGCNTDLCLNDISLNDKNTMCVYHKNTRYLFTAKDLVKIIVNAITNHHLFFAEPQAPKNPYNNIPFSKSNLYNIYMFVRFRAQLYNDLFFKFFECGFHLTAFLSKYEYLLRECSIKTFIDGCSIPFVVEEIHIMLNSFNNNNNNHAHNYKKKITVHLDFPSMQLIKIMKPYLLLHLQKYYSLVDSVIQKANHELFKKLTIFQKYNPQFGRKLVKLAFQDVVQDVNQNAAERKKTSFVKSVIFNDAHVPFEATDENDTARFMTNHLKLDVEQQSDSDDSDDDDTNTSDTDTIGFEHDGYNDNDNDNDNDDDDDSEHILNEYEIQDEIDMI